MEKQISISHIISSVNDEGKSSNLLSVNKVVILGSLIY